MRLFGAKRVDDRIVPIDPNDQAVEEIRASYPYGAEAFGTKAIIRVAVYVVLEMKKRGMI